MEENANGDLLIGRINRKEEKALGLSLTSSVLVYISEDDLDRMAANRPDRYLSDLEQIKTIIKEPDYVLYREDAEQFYFLKEYLKNHEFRKVLVKAAHVGTPKRWMLLSVGCVGNDELRSDDISYGYAKIN